MSFFSVCSIFSVIIATTYGNSIFERLSSESQTKAQGRKLLDVSYPSSEFADGSINFFDSNVQNSAKRIFRFPVETLSAAYNDATYPFTNNIIDSVYLVNVKAGVLIKATNANGDYCRIFTKQDINFYTINSLETAINDGYIIMEVSGTGINDAVTQININYDSMIIFEDKTNNNILYDYEITAPMSLRQSNLNDKFGGVYFSNTPAGTLLIVHNSYFKGHHSNIFVKSNIVGTYYIGSYETAVDDSYIIVDPHGTIVDGTVTAMEIFA